MSGETERQVSGWTVDTSRQSLLKIIDDLEKYISRRFLDQDKAVQAALQAAKEAVNKAEVANEKQFEAANNVKATFSGDLSRKLDRTEYDSNHKALEDKIDALTDRMNRKDGVTSGGELTIGKIYAAIAAAATIIGLAIAFIK